jgi:hypothetical protein
LPNFSAIFFTVKNSLPFINIIYIFGRFRKNIATSCILLNVCKGELKDFLKNCYRRVYFLLTIIATSGNIICID